jgi:hypothetical protein
MTILDSASAIIFSIPLDRDGIEYSNIRIFEYKTQPCRNVFRSGCVMYNFFCMQNFHVKKIIHHDNAFVMH